MRDQKIAQWERESTGEDAIEDDDSLTMAGGGLANEGAIKAAKVAETLRSS